MTVTSFLDGFKAGLDPKEAITQVTADLPPLAAKVLRTEGALLRSALLRDDDAPTEDLLNAMGDALDAVMDLLTSINPNDEQRKEMAAAMPLVAELNAIYDVLTTEGEDE